MIDIPEPPDETRIEWEYGTDVYGAWKDVRGSVEAGYPAENCWVVYPESVPQTWPALLSQFGDSLLGAFILSPTALLTDTVPDDYTAEGKRQREEFRARDLAKHTEGAQPE